MRLARVLEHPPPNPNLVLVRPALRACSAGAALTRSVSCDRPDDSRRARTRVDTAWCCIRSRKIVSTRRVGEAPLRTVFGRAARVALPMQGECQQLRRVDRERRPDGAVAPY